MKVAFIVALTCSSASFAFHFGHHKLMQSKYFINESTWKCLRESDKWDSCVLNPCLQVQGQCHHQNDEKQISNKKCMKTYKIVDCGPHFNGDHENKSVCSQNFQNENECPTNKCKKILGQCYDKDYDFSAKCVEMYGIIDWYHLCTGLKEKEDYREFKHMCCRKSMTRVKNTIDGFAK